jgi:hypothetical protein
MRFLALLLLGLNSVQAAADDCACLPGPDALARAPVAAGTGTQQQVLRQYAVFSYRNIADAVIMGRGPYLETLQELFAPACASAPVFNRWLQQLLLDTPGITDFARQLAAAHHLAGHCMRNDSAAMAPPQPQRAVLQQQRGG